MKILVVGAGAVGSLFGARLAGAGHAVQLYGRTDHVAAVQAHGVRVEGTDPATYHPGAVTDLREANSPDVVLLTVKTFDLGPASTSVARRFPAPATTLLPQNGLNIEVAVAGALRSAGWSDPIPWLVRAVNSVPVTWMGPGVVRQAGRGELILQDPNVAGRSSASTALVYDLLSGAGIPVRVVPDLERELWRKALVNAAINPVTAIHRVPNGRLLGPPYRGEARRLLREAQRAAASVGFSFPDAEADRDLGRVVRATAENRSSMLQDRERGRPTEIDAISGEIVRTAAAHGVDLPETRAVIARLRSVPPSATVGAQSS